MPTMMTVDDAYRWMLEQRGIGNACRDCGGFGVKTYPSTSTWRGGIGGQMMTNGVCDKCWGSGDADRKWPSHRATPTAPRREMMANNRMSPFGVTFCRT